MEREKLCISCEGRISLNTEVCPYCGSDQNEPKMENSFQAPIFQHQSLEESLTSLYNPPYQGKRPQFMQTEDIQETHDPIYTQKTQYKDVTESPIIDPLLGATVEEEQNAKTTLWPTLLLLIGANIFILGLMQLFFSKNGKLLLEWNAHYWFLYCIIGGPLFYFGYKMVKELTD